MGTKVPNPVDTYVGSRRADAPADARHESRKLGRQFSSYVALRRNQTIKKPAVAERDAGYSASIQSKDPRLILHEIGLRA
jgi:hypothetical protein